MPKTVPLFTVGTLALLLPSCVGSHGGNASLDKTSLPRHVVEDFSHPWHAYPAQAVGLPIGVGLAVVTLPVSFVEAAVSESHPFSKSNPGVVWSGAVYVGLGVGFLVGLPFFVLGLPFEHSSNGHGVKHPERSQEQPVKRDAPQRDDRSANP